MKKQFILDLHGEMIVDNFAGGGGASTGIELALGRCTDIAIDQAANQTNGQTIEQGVML